MGAVVYGDAETLDKLAAEPARYERQNESRERQKQSQRIRPSGHAETLHHYRRYR